MSEPLPKLSLNETLKIKFIASPTPTLKCDGKIQLIPRNYSLNLVSVRSLSNQPFLLFISYKLLQLFNSTKFAKCCDASNSNNFQTYLLVVGNFGIISVFLMIFKCFPEKGRMGGNVFL